MKKLYLIDVELDDGHRDDLLVIDDASDVMDQVVKHLQQLKWLDDEVGVDELIEWKRLAVYPVAAFDLSGAEYEVNLTCLKQEA